MMIRVGGCSSAALFLLVVSSLHCAHAAVRKATGTPTPFLEYNLHKKTPLGNTNNGWHFLPGDYNNDGKVDMYAIKQNGANAKTEVHILNGADNYSSYLLHATTALQQTDSNWDFALGDRNNDGKPDLWAFNKNGATSTEVHILNGANFGQFLLQSTTALHKTNLNWDFHVADYDKDGTLDIVCIFRRGGTNTAVHVMDGASGFTTFSLQVRTTLGLTDVHWTFALGDYNEDGTIDLYAIQKNGATGTEVTVLNGANRFRGNLLQSRTALHRTNQNWQFQVADFDGDGKNELLSINTFAGTATNFHFMRAATRERKWSDASIWTGSGTPGPSDVAVIPAGKNVVLDADATVHGVEIDGGLFVRDLAASIHLQSDFILITDGILQAGTAAKPYTNKFTVSLTGEDANANLQGTHGVSGENAFLAVTGNRGKLHLHGASSSKVAWTQLGATLAAGARSMKLKEAVNWVVGDRIVVASTDFLMSQTEEFTIQAISNDKTTITLNRAATHMHYGQLQTYSNSQKTWTLDERAEVGLLSRNIVIQGGANSGLTKYGGHVIVKNGGFAQVEGCEFTKMGQFGIIGKYPWHWHMLGDTSNQYFKDNSVHHTFNRAVTIHGTSNALVQDNVCYDHIGHGYFLEDGSERRNRFIRNLGLMTRKMDAATATIPTDHDHVSTFWLTNPDNTLIGNVAGGSDFAGFWYALPPTPTGDSASQTHIKPRYTPFGEFRGNTGHTNRFSNFAIDGSPDPVTQKLIGGHYRPRNADGSVAIALVTDFTSYKCMDRGIWMRSDTFDFADIKNADNARSTFFAFSQTMSDSLIVGRSANKPDSFRRQFRGHSIYDGPCGLDGVHFAGFSGNDQAIQTNGAAQKSTVHYVKNLSFAADTPVANRVDFSPFPFLGQLWSSGLRDLDGTLTGKAGTVIMTQIKRDPNSPNHFYDEQFNVAPTTTYRSDWSAYLNEGSHYGLMRLNPTWGKYNGEEVQVTRCNNAGSDCHTVTDRGNYNWYYQNPVIISQGFTYEFSFPKLPKSFRLTLGFVKNNDKVLVKVNNVPPGTNVYQAREVSSMNAVRSASTTSYIIQDGHLWVQLVGSGLTNDRNAAHTQPFGNVFSAKAVVGVTISDGNDPLRYNPLADFNTGVDPRGALAGARGATYRGIATGWSNTINWWDVKSAADGRNGYVDYRFTPSVNTQSWQHYQSLQINTKLAGRGKSPNKQYSYQVFVRDRNQGYTNLGICETGVCTLNLKSKPDNRLDNVQWLLIRVHVAFFTELGTVDAYQRVHLYSLTLV